MKTKVVSSKDIANDPNLSLRAEDYVGKKSYADMSKDEKIEELEAALIDLLDAHPDLYAVQAITGGSSERAEEISDLYHEVEKEYTLRHKIEG